MKLLFGNENVLDTIKIALVPLEICFYIAKSQKSH
jgi:hypothetical protein